MVLEYQHDSNVKNLRRYEKDFSRVRTLSLTFVSFCFCSSNSEGFSKVSIDGVVGLAFSLGWRNPIQTDLVPLLKL